MRRFLHLLVTALAVACVQAVAADLVTPDCHYVGPPTTNAKRLDIVAACLRAKPEGRRAFQLLGPDEPPPAPTAPTPRVGDPQPALDLSTGNLLLLAPVKP